MSIFVDKVYEELDFMSQATKAPISSLLKLISKVPDVVELSQAEVLKSYKDGGSLVTKDIVSRYVNIDEMSDLRQYFKIEFSDDFELNITKSQMIGTAEMIKTGTIDELLNKIKKNALSNIRMKLSKPTGIYKRRIKKLSKALSIPVATNNRQQATINMLTNGLLKLWFNDESNIYNYDLFDKIHCWVVNYVHNENTASIANLSRLKTMGTLSDNPIYSIQELK